MVVDFFLLSDGFCKLRGFFVLLNTEKRRWFSWLQVEESVDVIEDSWVSSDDNNDTDDPPLLEQAPIVGWSGESWDFSGVVRATALEGAVPLPSVGNVHRDSPMLEQAPTASWDGESEARSGDVSITWEGAVPPPSVGSVHRDFPALEQAPTAPWSGKPGADSGAVTITGELGVKTCFFSSVTTRSISSNSSTT